MEFEVEVNVVTTVVIGQKEPPTTAAELPFKMTLSCE